MEQKLVEWIKLYIESHKEFPDNNLIKKKALVFSSKNNFKASKGWCDKFFKRNQDFFEELMSK